MAIAIMAFGSPVGAQDEPETLIEFESLSLSEATELPKAATDLIEAGGQTKFTALDASDLMDQLQGTKSVRLGLFENLSLSLAATESSDGVAGSRFWAAEGNGVWATFTELNGWFDGRVVAGPSLYRIIGVDDGIALVAEDRIAYPPEGAAVAPEASADSAAGESGSAPLSEDVSTSAFAIDVLAWYDPGALSYFGSSSAAEAAIAGSYNNANLAGNRAAANVQFNLVDLSYVGTSLSSNSSTALSNLRGTNDGAMDQIHAARDAAGADLVAAITNLNGVCGRAYLPSSAAGNAAYAFSVTAPNCVGGNLTLVHETGHNLGAGHDIANGSGTFSYSNGFINPAQGYRTVMSYFLNCSGCQRLAYFSSPTGSYNGQPTGNAATDNGRTLRELAPAVSSYRTASVATVVNADITELEGDNGTKRLRVWFTLDKPAIPFDGTGFASMRVATADGTATLSDRDYRKVTRNVRWGPGVTSRFVDFRITGDTKREPTEYFDIVMSTPNKVDLGDGVVRVFITNDDTDAEPTVSVLSKTVTETDRNQVVKLTVQLDRPASATTRVRYTTTPGSATASDDYVNRSGLVSIPKGKTSRTFNVTLRGDLDQEPQEYFNVVLSQPVGLTLGSNAVVTVNDNDQPPPTVTVENVSVTETDRNQVLRVTFRLNRPANATTRVRYETASGSASSGSDFVNRRGTVTFPRGQTSKTVNVTIKGDRIAESTERFYIDMNSPTGLVISGYGTVTIVDND